LIALKQGQRKMVNLMPLISLVHAAIVAPNAALAPFPRNVRRTGLNAFNHARLFEHQQNAFRFFGMAYRTNRTMTLTGSTEEHPPADDCHWVRWGSDDTRPGRE